MVRRDWRAWCRMVVPVMVHPDDVSSLRSQRNEDIHSSIRTIRDGVLTAHLTMVTLRGLGRLPAVGGCVIGHRAGAAENPDLSKRDQPRYRSAHA